ncbi:iron-sulfur cluster assembly scaffold protein [Altericroceibacterium spongiae]|uniref:Iron-sulfur cluster assembly scaffold protein n=2 Tax=Altericroceibacterium spongiae TaxID=2320269 RepID=A0A420ES16_9SPHN|nr:iron-sulfur cluster assembly scaffold protein [Altericroceibacterium spongiae]
MSSPEKLYTPELLGLTVELAEYPAKTSLSFVGDARSPSCGSMLTLNLETDASGHICDLGMAVQACAIGQASAAIFARHAQGKKLADIERMQKELDGWLEHNGALPDWPDIELIATARDFPGRHGAIRLPWQAAQRALTTSP